MWFYHPPGEGGGIIGTYGLPFRIAASSTTTTIILRNENSGVICSGVSTHSANKWQHLVVKYDGTEVNSPRGAFREAFQVELKKMALHGLR